MHSPIDTKFLKSFAAGTLEIHCGHVQLTQNAASGGHRFAGPGVITVTDDGDQFLIRLYSEVHDPLLAFNMWSDPEAWPEPGVILPPETFYALEARSFEGHLWSSPRVSVRVHAGHGATLIMGRCPRLHTTAEPTRVREGEVLHLVSFSDLEIPLNRLVTQTITSGDKVLFESHAFGRTEFTHQGVQFEFEKLQDPLGASELICRSPKALPIAYGQRLQEALRLMTFAPMSWAVSQQSLRGAVTVTLSASPPQPSGVFPAPIPTHEAGEDFWRLFCRYLDHVCRHSDPDTCHRLSAYLKPLLSLQKLQVESVALALGVATEGILNSEHPAVGEPTQQFRDTVQHLEKLAARIKCTDENLRKRVRGSIQNLTQRRPKDALVVLRDRGIISQHHYKAWESLRNSAAHAGVIDEDSIQLRLTQCYNVYELILRLVVLAVGYTGKYRQTGVPDWPTGTFERTLADIAPPKMDGTNAAEEQEGISPRPAPNPAPQECAAAVNPTAAEPR